MKENKYDDEAFFAQYEQMQRSVKGLQGVGEWHAFKEPLPSLKDKTILDLGCGFGWYCKYASKHGAKENNATNNIRSLHCAMEDVDYIGNHYDVVLSSLAFHYMTILKHEVIRYFIH